MRSDYEESKNETNSRDIDSSNSAAQNNQPANKHPRLERLETHETLQEIKPEEKIAASQMQLPKQMSDQEIQRKRRSIAYADNVCAYLIQNAFSSSEPQDMKQYQEFHALSQRCIRLLERVFVLFPHVLVKYSIFNDHLSKSYFMVDSQSSESKTIREESNSEQKNAGKTESARKEPVHGGAISVALQIFELIVKYSDSTEQDNLAAILPRTSDEKTRGLRNFVLEHMRLFPNLVKVALVIEHAAINDSLAQFIRTMLSRYPPECPIPQINESKFYRHLHDIIQQCLRACASASTPYQPQSINMLLKVLHTISVDESKFICSLLNVLCDVLLQISIEYIRQRNDITSTSPANQDAPSNKTSAVSDKLASNEQKQGNTDIVESNILLCIEIVSRHVGWISHRQPLIKSIGLLLMQCSGLPVVKAVFHLISPWMLPITNTSLFSPEDKAAVLRHLCDIEAKMDRPLQRSYFELVYNLWRGCIDTKIEILEKQLIQCCTSALCFPEYPLRRRFFAIMSGTLPVSFLERLLRLLNHNWADVKGKYWIPVALDLLLASLPPDLPVVIPNLVKLPILSRRENSYSNLNHDVQMDALESGSVALLSSSQLALAQEHFQLIEQAKALHLRDILDPFQELLYADPVLAHRQWIELIPMLWSALSGFHSQLMEAFHKIISMPKHPLEKEYTYSWSWMPLISTKKFHSPLFVPERKNQSSTSESNSSMPIETLLLNGYCSAAMITCHPNTSAAFGPEARAPIPLSPASTLLEAIIECHPLPLLSPDLLRYQAFRMGNWTPAIIMAERAMLYSENKSAYSELLRSIYMQLHEQDEIFGVERQCCRLEHTNSALLYLQHGEWSRAKDLFHQQMQAIQVNPTPRESITNVDIQVMVDRQIECCEKLLQWEDLLEFSKSVCDVELALESSFRLKDLSMVKDLVSTTLFGLKEADDVGMKIFRIVAIFHQNKQPQVDVALSECVQLFSRQWCGLPNGGSLGGHIRLLHYMQRIVELEESIDMLREVIFIKPNQTLPDFKSLLKAWRERLPHQWDSLDRWDAILCWRNHFFSFVYPLYEKRFSALMVSASQEQQKTVQDRLAQIQDSIWTTVQLAKAARKQNHHSVSSVIVNKSAVNNTTAMDVSDAFSKLVEQVKLCIKAPCYYLTGLVYINNTNISYFNQDQQAELFRLRGKLLDLCENTDLSQKQEAQHSFSTAARLYQRSSLRSCKVWKSWGDCCSSLYSSNHELQWAAQAMCCYMDASHSNSLGCLLRLARVLWVLGQDDAEGTLKQTFSKYVKFSPDHVWLLYLPYLLSGLLRLESEQMKDLLSKIVLHYPQSLYYNLRCMYMHSLFKHPQNQVGSTRDIQESSVSKSDHEGKGSQPITQSQLSSDAYTQLFELAKRTHPQLCYDLDHLLEEISGKFQTNLAYELLNTIQSILTRCYQISNPFSDQSILPILHNAIKSMCEKIFVHPRISKNPDYSSVSKYHDDFMNDMQPLLHASQTQNVFLNVNHIISKLRLWVLQLEKDLGVGCKTNLHLSKFSQRLVDFSSRDAEIPGQYWQLREPDVDFNIRIERISTIVERVTKNGLPHYVISLRGSNGLLYRYLIQTTSSQIIRFCFTLY